MPGRVTGDPWMNYSPDDIPVRSRAEDIYFGVYSVAVEESDVLQPETEDQLLPEAIISAFASTTIGAFLGGYFGEQGKALWSKTTDLWTARGKMRDAEPETVIETLAGQLRTLDSAPGSLAAGQDEVVRALRELGVGGEAAKRIATRITAIIVKPAD
jgi:hypothetical protein